MHASLRASRVEHLTPQDGQGFRPHVTVQNKVPAEVARQTRDTLAVGFAAYDVAAGGLDLWRYDGGPWSHVERHPFGPLG